jgi:hypothetical protein
MIISNSELKKAKSKIKSRYFDKGGDTQQTSKEGKQKFDVI